jgi:ferredoxin
MLGRTNDMELRIDRDGCNGYGNCVFAAPDVLDLNPETNIVELVRAATDSDRAALIEAAADCPVRALTVVDDRD